MAVQNLELSRDPIRFFARFGGKPFEVEVPSGAVLAVFARENGEGIVFSEVESSDSDGSGTPPEPPSGPTKRKGTAKLRVIK